MPRKAGGRNAGDAGNGARFNEAGAVMPRKAMDLKFMPPRPPGFNEAGAVMPRKAKQRQLYEDGRSRLQ